MPSYPFVAYDVFHLMNCSRPQINSLFITLTPTSSGDKARCRMGRRRGMATHAQGTLPQLVGLSTDTTCGLESSLLHVYVAYYLFGSVNSELRLEWMASRTTEYQSNDRTECRNVDSNGSEVHATYRKPRRVVSIIQSHDFACWVNPLLS